MFMRSKHILFSVLNWGLGHATRSIPIINALLERKAKVTIASDGLALAYLQNQFPACQFLPLPSLDVSYTDRGSQTLAVGKSIIKNSTWYKHEREVVKTFLAINKVDGIISDNRPTTHSPEIHSVYLTHQLKVRAGFLTPIASLGHANFYKRYHEIWVPDIEDMNNLSGDLSRTGCTRVVKFIGPLSNLTPQPQNTRFELGIILSGPEPQRTILEEKLFEQLQQTTHTCWFVRGTNAPLTKTANPHWKITHVADRSTINNLYAQCEVIVCRNGYTSLMDLYTWPKPAVLIPTPGQPEQEYLSNLPNHNNHFAHGQQDDFSLNTLITVAKEKHAHFTPVKHTTDWDRLFRPVLGKG